MKIRVISLYAGLSFSVEVYLQYDLRQKMKLLSVSLVR